MVTFIDSHRAHYGVEPICQVLPIAPSTYYAHKARQVDPGRRPPRVCRDAVLRDEIQRIWLIFMVSKHSAFAKRLRVERS